MGFIFGCIFGELIVELFKLFFYIVEIFLRIGFKFLKLIYTILKWLFNLCKRKISKQPSNIIVLKKVKRIKQKLNYV